MSSPSTPFSLAKYGLKSRFFGFKKRHPVKGPTEKDENWSDFQNVTITAEFSGFLGVGRHDRKKGFDLPVYGPECQISTDYPLVCLDILEALLDNYWRARMILYETARKGTPLALMLSRKTVQLDSIWLPLDNALAAMLQDPHLSGWVGVGMMCPYCSPGQCCDDLWEKHKDMLLADPEIAKMSATARTTFLRLDKEFRKTVIDPLKHRMIHNTDVSHEAIESQVRGIHNQANTCISTLRSDFYNRQMSLCTRR